MKHVAICILVITVITVGAYIVHEGSTILLERVQVLTDALDLAARP